MRTHLNMHSIPSALVLEQTTQGEIMNSKTPKKISARLVCNISHRILIIIRLLSYEARLFQFCGIKFLELRRMNLNVRKIRVNNSWSWLAWLNRCKVYSIVWHIKFQDLKFINILDRFPVRIHVAIFVSRCPVSD